MTGFEVETPILNNPFDEPKEHWHIVEGELPVRKPGRRPAMYFYKPPTKYGADSSEAGYAIELKLVNIIRGRMKNWAAAGWAGVSRTTLELLQYWRREGRERRLFFAQIEAAETVIFQIEARQDFKQGIEIPIDGPSDEKQSQGFSAFRRYACKMATGTGKTAVMGMLAAWSILNKVSNRSDGRFSDCVAVVCPNVTIRNRLQELKPENGEASIYRVRDIVPSHLMADLNKGRVLVTNWHVFEPQVSQVGGVSAKVNGTGVPIQVTELVHIGSKTTSLRGKRYLSLAELQRQVNAGLVEVLEEQKNKSENLVAVRIRSTKHIESETALLNRVLGREVGGKQNILVMNDEAHHAYRLKKVDSENDGLGDEDDDDDTLDKEATVWVDGLDLIHKHRGINFCVDLSATPCFLARAGQDTNRIFPWTVCEFGLTDAIESGLVKIPQLAVRDTTGQDIPGYFNIWRWLLPKLTTSERGGQRGNPKPEAVLKWAHTPIAMLGGLWDELRLEWEETRPDGRPPVFIIVCKNTKIAKVVHEWLGENRPPVGIPPAAIKGFVNMDGAVNTIRIDSKVVLETDSGLAKSDESRWMRVVLDTVGKLDWPHDRQGRPIYPEDFEELAKKLVKPLHPPGRDIRCIVSVGMLTEGWDCNTVTHIIGLRPFMSQLLCEQVVGRGLRRSNYDVGPDGKFSEEVAKVFGVPFEVIPFKANKNGPKPEPVKRHHIHSIPEKVQYEIKFPRVEGYFQRIRNRIKVDWDIVPVLKLDPLKIPPEVEMKTAVPNNRGRPNLTGPGALQDVTLNPFRKGRRIQELIFELAGTLTKEYCAHAGCQAPSYVLFPQLVGIAQTYVCEFVQPIAPAERIDVFLSPYYGWVIERIAGAIRPDDPESQEIPRFEKNRGPGSTAEVDFWTGRDVREVIHSHLNYVVADTGQWEQAATYILDIHPGVASFAKNAGLGLAIPYIYNGRPHDYIPDFVIRLKREGAHFLILETKGYDELAGVKKEAAIRWVRAVTKNGEFGTWHYEMARKPEEIRGAIEKHLL